ncbi:MAG: TatD family hydrolase [Rhodospirillales bacterium]|nr:TatD family hydrolase [Rhodospirillales bacterium]MCY3857136.1 TatD family hydrolase [Rhodospirillales bacterium]MCY4003523.1 TatD family hydrolase [Rhodospirillales bacterium]MCY4098398.1 TatD family hydrolase [Rhodospirillales bacterium]MXX22234.1 TatD family deoxyribonuclease [Rhodospirillales bacterium]
MLVDSHCHLDFPAFADDFPAMLERARAAGVQTLQTISTRLATVDTILDVASRDPDIWCSVGLHPHEAATEEDVSPDRIVALSDHPDVIGVGETGLDYYYEHSPRERQQESFRNHIEASRRTGLPLIVHARDADDDIVAVLREEYEAGPFPGLIHCFTAGPELARAALDIGFLISISGIVTFKKAENVHAAAREVPLDRLLVETDSPFLAPVPHRGKRCEPAFVARTAAAIAELRQIDPSCLAEATTDNFFRLFSKAKRPAN